MKVVEYDRYGDPSVLVVRERPDPVARPGRVGVRVRAAALNPKDVLTRTSWSCALAPHGSRLAGGTGRARPAPGGDRSRAAAGGHRRGAALPGDAARPGQGRPPRRIGPA